MEAQVRKIDFKDQNIYVGFDVHKKSWKVTVMAEDTFYKTFTQPPNPEVLFNYLKSNFPGGNYHTAYEAGFCGYWTHDKLTSFGIKSIIVNPADIPTTDKERVQKEDKRDSRKIARSLSSGTLMPIYTPSIQTLRDRSLLRSIRALFNHYVFVSLLENCHPRWADRMNANGPVVGLVAVCVSRWRGFCKIRVNGREFSRPNAVVQMDESR